MVKKNYTGEFRFICYTDDASDLECEVHPIPDDDLLHPKYYFGKEAFCFDRAKFLVFNSEEWLDCEPEDKFCYFDLDIVIQSNIDEIDTLAEKPRIIHCLWQQQIYYDVYENNEIVFKTFFKGSDNYHYWRQREFWKNIPDTWIYSWNRGRYYPDDVVRFEFRDDAKICLFNTDNVPHPSAKQHVELAECNDKNIVRLWK
jgi:hypothetical protein